MEVAGCEWCLHLHFVSRNRYYIIGIGKPYMSTYEPSIKASEETIVS